jgi:hypothetical protein
MIPSYINLARLSKYLKRYHNNDQPAAFEYLVASVFSQIFYLPFQSKSNEDNKINHRVIWYGDVDKKRKTITKSPSGLDSICFACGFYTLIESTLRGNVTSQWQKEFIQSLKHYDDFVKDRNADKKDVYLALIAPTFHKDTYTGFKQKANEGYNLILLESSSLAKVAEISKIVFTIRHLDLRVLLNKFVKNLCESTSFDKLKGEFNKSISEWGKHVFKNEKTVFFGLKAYEAMKKTDRIIVGISDILLNLHKDSKFKHYLKIFGGGDLTSYVKDGLLSEKLACLIETPDEDYFCMVNSADFKERGRRLIKEVEKING